MLIKLLSVLVLTSTSSLTECAKLRKTPKVYNALITTDENLQQSKAYPLVQPVIQPAAIPLYPVNVYDQYSSSDNGKNENQHAERKSDAVQITNNGAPENFQSQNQPEHGTEKPLNGEKSPIELNEFGLPPSLIPLQKYPTYPYNLPFFYDSYGNYQTIQYPVLPPFGYYNPNEEHLPPIEQQPMFEVRPGRNLKQEPKEEKEEEEKVTQPSTQLDESFKNNANKNANIPDIIPELPYHLKKN